MPKLYEPCFVPTEEGLKPGVVVVPIIEDGDPPEPNMVMILMLCLYKDHKPRLWWQCAKDCMPYATMVSAPGSNFRERMAMMKEYINGSVTERLASLIFLPVNRERDCLQIKFFGEEKGLGVVTSSTINAGEFITEYCGQRTLQHPVDDKGIEDTLYVMQLEYDRRQIL